MGWTSQHREQGIKNTEFFRLADHQEYVATATVNNVFYAAVRDTNEDRVYAMIIICQWSPKEYFNFTYKELGESAGPGYVHAPAKVLDALDPADCEYALTWRKQCRDRLQRRAALAKAKEGARVQFNATMRFTDGSERQEFILAYRGHGPRRRTVLTDESGRVYQVPNWRDAARLVA